MPAGVREAFGRRVRELREAAGMTQEVLAAKARLHRNYVGGIERGERNLSLDSIAKLATALGVPIAIFFVPQDSLGRQGRGR